MNIGLNVLKYMSLVYFMNLCNIPEANT